MKISRGESFMVIMLPNFDENCGGVRLGKIIQRCGSKFVNNPNFRGHVSEMPFR
jgi:hypothetical protein